MLNRKFEKFRGGPSDRFNSRNDIRVTINKRGLIYFNSRMYRILGDPKAVALFYNREEDSIAIQADNERSFESFPVIKKQSGWAVHSSTFCRHFGIRVPETQRFIRPDIDNDRIVILSLRHTVLVGGLKRKKVSDNGGR